MSFFSLSINAEQLLDQTIVGAQRVDASGVCDVAGVENNDFVRDVQRQLDVLFDENDRKAAAAKLLQNRCDLRDDLGANPSEGSSNRIDARIRHQGPADREHLLFAAGQ